MIKPKLLFVTDLYYDAKQRRYADEDLYLTSQLRGSFNITICHPCDTQPFEDTVDLIVCRNTGPVIYYLKAYYAFRNRLITNKKRVYNSLSGQADMLGKQYLVDLSKGGYPVIPTIDDLADINHLPSVENYLMKPKQGADSHGIEVVSKDNLDKLSLSDSLLQPKIEIDYEISFYYIDKELQYVLHAPDKQRRWQLVSYDFSAEDSLFAQQFVNWNKLEFGIQRVDACRTVDGQLLLVELEDLNPYLSLLDQQEATRQRFVNNFKNSLCKVLQT